MPTVAAYLVLQDPSVTIGGEASSDHHLQFEVPSDLEVDARAPAILAFRVDPIGEVTLTVRLNQTEILTQPFKTEPQRSWHEVFSARALRAEGNELVMSVPSDSPPGKVSVSDVVLFLPTTTS